MSPVTAEFASRCRRTAKKKKTNTLRFLRFQYTTHTVTFAKAQRKRELKKIIEFSIRYATASFSFLVLFHAAQLAKTKMATPVLNALNPDVLRTPTAQAHSTRDERSKQDPHAQRPERDGGNSSTAHP